jgi:hypothetical protein
MNDSGQVTHGNNFVTGLRFHQNLIYGTSFYRQYKMFVEHSTSGAFTLLLSVDFKFVDDIKKNV